jgi:hypothetical protein
MMKGVDWQSWFLPLRLIGSRQRLEKLHGRNIDDWGVEIPRWYLQFLELLLTNDEVVVNQLMKSCPISIPSIHAIRVAIYEYRYKNDQVDGNWEVGSWWKRRYIGLWGKPFVKCL